MFLEKLGADDSRFKTLDFHEGMNLIVADRDAESTDEDSRNGAGKTSFVRILRYLLGGKISKTDALATSALKDFVFKGFFDFPGSKRAESYVVERPLHPQTRLKINHVDRKIDEWRGLLCEVYGLTPGIVRPSLGQLVEQTVRLEFDDAVKVNSWDSKWEDGARIGYFFGFSPKVLSAAGEISAIKKNQRQIKKAVKDGALPGVSLNAAEIRPSLVAAKAERDNLANQLREFTVDEEYANHQRLANSLSRKLKDLSDEIISLGQRRDDLQRAMDEEEVASSDVVDNDVDVNRLSAMYKELGVLLPDTVLKRYEQVEKFHSSVIQNRRLYLQSELTEVKQKLKEAEKKRKELDSKRAETMQLLESSMALETFMSAQKDLNDLEVKVERLNNQLKLAHDFESNGLDLTEKTAAAQLGVRREIDEHQLLVDEAIGLFSQFGTEIYGDRDVELIINDSKSGMLEIDPRIGGDKSAGIGQVKTFILDMVCTIMGIQNGRSPRLLVHDSKLFDSMDSRQVASCLNIGARQAEKYGFEYIVTMNSDRLEQIKHEFNSERYVINTKLSDQGSDGGLFGFRFE
ncbi:DUF2326 domain-containing protein [Bifidobacterium sp. ESL0690]|uniref:ABC-three component system protein n=1 Tax=Bifidobacterium sp. ESL0690 TaxID=2983214 RepID=UPI0023F8FCCD|nr:ABC-three component system protein [Bifidobacterium sp. ESL0690]WEV46244.1 DUF2326 domain-containing protein [Bifidobacterium sp. ESL0690]